MKKYIFLDFNGTIINDTAIAQTPISGDFAAAAAKSELSVITRVEIPTTNKPEITPEKAPEIYLFHQRCL